MRPQSNGNLITDSGKGITTPIAYNHLNLPRQITASAGAFTHTYTATGQKLRMTVPPSGAEGAKTVDYAAGLVYENSSLAFIPTAEGRILPPTKAVNPEVLPGDANALKNSFYRYEYQLKDQRSVAPFGNLRVACRCAEIANATSPRDSYAPIAVQENQSSATPVRPLGFGLAIDRTKC